MFGCYRRDEAADPDTFVAAVTMVLSRYSAAIVDAVTDPYSGLPSRKNERGYSGLPDVADVKEACEAEAQRIERYKQLGNRSPIPRIAGPKPGPGAFANGFCPPDAPQYAGFVERAKTADPREWRYDEKRPGIWVSYAWHYDAPTVKRTGFSTLTAEQLRAMYPPREPAQPASVPAAE